MLFNPRYYRRLFPELMEFETDQTREDAWDRAVTSVLKSGWYYALLVPAFLGLFVPLIWALDYTSAWRWLPSDLQPLLALLVMAFVGAGLPLVAFRWHVRRVLREYLDTQRGLICRSCGYNLTGLTEPRCPECGQAFDKARLSTGRTPTADHTEKDGD